MELKTSEKMSFMLSSVESPQRFDAAAGETIAGR